MAVTDEQAPLPEALWQLVTRIRSGLAEAGDFVFNCQMGRGRTTTGMVAACLISTITKWDGKVDSLQFDEEEEIGYDSIDGPSEEDAYLQGGRIVFVAPFHILMTLGARGVQDYLAACRSALERKNRQATHGPSHRPDARRAKSTQNDIRVRTL